MFSQATSDLDDVKFRSSTCQYSSVAIGWFSHYPAEHFATEISKIVSKRSSQCRQIYILSVISKHPS